MIPKFSVKKPYTILVGVLLIVILGVVSFTRLTPDLMPSMDLPYAIIMTTYGGASPEAVETAVTKPIEQSMATISNIENISSVSQENVSLVILEFNGDANMDTAMIDMRESLDMITSYFPDTIGNPIIMKLNPDMLPVLVAAVDAEGKDVGEISKMVEDEILPELESVEGVGSVSASGLLEETVNVVLNPDKIEKANKELKKALEKSFEKAEEEMESAKDALESGKSELNSQRETLNKTLAEANNALINGKIDLATKKSELTSTLTSLNTTIGQLESIKGELDKQKGNLESSIATVEEAKAERTKLDGEKAALESKKAEIEGDASLTEEEKAVKLAEIETELKKVNASISENDRVFLAQATTALTADATIATLETAVKALNLPLDELNTQLETAYAGREQIELGLSQLEAGQDTLNIQLTGLDEQKNTAQQGMSSAEMQILLGESQLITGEQQLEAAREEALKKASLEGIITQEMITGILTAQNFAMPAGYITEEDTEYLVRVGDKFEETDDIGDLVLVDMGLDDMDPITLNDVADVTVLDNSGEIYAKVNGNNSVIVTVQKQNNYATADVSDRVQEKFEELTEEKAGLHFTNLMDQGIYIDLIIDSVLNNLWMGAVFAVIVLLFFLKSIKPTLIVAVSIPVSVLLAIVLMYFSGVTLNMISLSGLALGVGMLVDNSIVVIENIFRLKKEGMPIKEAAVEGANQVFGAIVASTLTTVSVFLPIVFVEGITKTLMLDMALTIGYSLLASLVVAVTVVPAMASKMMRKSEEKEDKLLPKFNGFYEKTMRVLLKYKVLIVAGSIVLMILSGYLALQKGSSIMPSMESTQLSATLTMPIGTELKDTKEMSDKIIDQIMTVEGVETVGASVGGGAMAGLSGNSGETSVSMYILLEEENERSNSEIQKEIEEKTKDFAGDFVVSGSNMDISALGGTGISIQIKGKDLDELAKVADDVAGIVEELEGTKDVSNGQKETTKELRVSVKKSKAMAYGLTVAQVYQAVSAKLSEGTSATTLETVNGEYTVHVRDGANDEITAENLKDMMIAGTVNGETKKVKLSKIAKIEEAVSPDSISRHSQSRYLTVSATVEEGYNVTLISQQIEEKLDNYDMPAGYSYKMGGEYETIVESMEQLLLMLVLAIAFMYLIMVSQFQSLKSPFIILFTIPLAFTGGFIGLMVCGMDVSIIAMFGFIMLSGVIVNNGIVLVDYINQLREGGMEKREAIILAGKTRIRPIIMTALTTIMGLSFMAAGVGDGAEMIQPMAVVTIGGLIYGTILTLVVVPCVYDLFHPERKPKKDELTVEV